MVCSKCLSPKYDPLACKLVTLQAEGSYFGPKHLMLEFECESITCKYDNLQDHGQHTI